MSPQQSDTNPHSWNPGSSRLLSLSKSDVAQSPLSDRAAPCGSSLLGKPPPKHNSVVRKHMFSWRVTCWHAICCVSSSSPQLQRDVSEADARTVLLTPVSRVVANEPSASCANVRPVLPTGDSRTRKRAYNRRKLGQQIAFRHNSYQDSLCVLRDQPLQKCFQQH